MSIFYLNNKKSCTALKSFCF